MKFLKYAIVWLALAGAVCAVWLLGPPEKTAPPSPEATPSAATPAPAEAVLSLPSPPAREELAGVWVPYMALAAKEHTREAFETNFKSIADSAKEKGLNALFVHVRAFCDALYPSELYPWSHLLTGTQGKDPGFDPLDFMVDYAHGLGLEFHAWINPLRVRTAETPAELSGDNPYQSLSGEYPYYFMEWESGVYLNPAYPYVRTLIAKGAAEIAEKYPVDGIHFDDYFYPAQDPALDEESYGLYRESVSEPLSLEEWRAANIDAMVAEVYDRVKAARPEAEFGISPQGNVENDSLMGADVAAWCAAPGYLDYICPQLYYAFENPVLNYTQALEKWQSLQKHEGLKLYVGLALYKAGDEEQGENWAGGDIISRQIEAARAVECSGVVLYSCDYLDAGQTQEEMRRAEETLADIAQRRED
ncbi:hypothetical protein D7X94_06120 [Acutalibacter sp. 1XD8-33]|uniref:glycoside hydrolase family 10 protein n=1 Tax=Acutalibacter sp. 1XD8-33 TaxID=2320081 RepID=UPI000EA36952|nr:family 10 glycosylhydrolase [Acutalibacter sp. 1XD8-33]RKJ40975.1 hypothetical protein D7X94_06120 [Acutalibacter sp. 1XD8-33]